MIGATERSEKTYVVHHDCGHRWECSACADFAVRRYIAHSRCRPAGLDRPYDERGVVCAPDAGIDAPDCSEGKLGVDKLDSCTVTSSILAVLQAVLDHRLEPVPTAG